MRFHHYHTIHHRLRGVRQTNGHANAVFSKGSLSPEQILVAYGFTKGQYKDAKPVKLGIGSLGGGVVQQDIQNSSAAWGMTAPNVTVRTVGGAKDDPTDQESNVENMLDLVPTMAFTWWWLTGSAADITICFGLNDAPDAMTDVTNDLVAAGVRVASWSWGSAANAWQPAERAKLAAAFQSAVASGVTFCAASGDDSVDDRTRKPTPDYPASDPNVWGVGGTRLILDPNTGARKIEAAWGDGKARDSGGGGGYDLSVPLPPFQAGVVHSTKRGVPDTSANADPQSGWQMSANGSWTVVGGTSASSPFTAALIAVARGLGYEGTIANIYADKNSYNDITTGSNGAPAAPGWDPATGLGSPHGPAFIDALK